VINEIKKFVIKNKQGILVGALAGLAGSWILGSMGANLNFSLQSVGLVDQLISTGTTTAKIAQTKVAIALMSIGAVMGGLIWEKW